MNIPYYMVTTNFKFADFVKYLQDFKFSCYKTVDKLQLQYFFVLILFNGNRVLLFYSGQNIRKCFYVLIYLL